jgi:hypothetical protein
VAGRRVVTRWVRGGGRLGLETRHGRIEAAGNQDCDSRLVKSGRAVGSRSEIRSPIVADGTAMLSSHRSIDGP